MTPGLGVILAGSWLVMLCQGRVCLGGKVISDVWCRGVECVAELPCQGFMNRGFMERSAGLQWWWPFQITPMLQFCLAFHPHTAHCWKLCVKLNTDFNKKKKFPTLDTHPRTFDQNTGKIKWVPFLLRNWLQHHGPNGTTGYTDFLDNGLLLWRKYVGVVVVMAGDSLDPVKLGSSLSSPGSPLIWTKELQLNWLGSGSGWDHSIPQCQHHINSTEVLKCCQHP